MTTIESDFYKHLQEEKERLQGIINDTRKDSNKNDRKSEFESDESQKWGYAAYFLGIIYYVLYAVCLLIFIYEKMYISLYNCILFLFLLFLPYLLYVYIVPILITLIDFILNKVIPKNIYYDI